MMGHKLAAQIIENRDRNFCRDGRSARPNVRGKIAKGEICFVADGRNNGDTAGGNGANELFVIETKEVFEGAAAAGDNEEVWRPIILDRLKIFDTSDKCTWGFGALNLSRVEADFKVWEAPREDGAHIVDDGARFTCDDADAPWQFGKRLPAGRIEEPFRGKFIPELNVLLHKFALASEFGRENDDAISAARRINCDIAENLNLHAILEAFKNACMLCFATLKGRLEHNGGDLGVGIFERKVGRARGINLEATNFRFECDARKSGLKSFAQALRQGSDGVNRALFGLRFVGHVSAS